MGKLELVSESRRGLIETDCWAPLGGCWVGPESVHFWQVPRRCGCCWSVNHTWRGQDCNPGSENRIQLLVSLDCLPCSGLNFPSYFFHSYKSERLHTHIQISTFKNWEGGKSHSFGIPIRWSEGIVPLIWWLLLCLALGGETEFVPPSPGLPSTPVN